MHFLNDFWPFSRQPVDWVRWNLVRSETKWIRRRRKRPDAKILSRYGDIWAQSCQKSTKITKILWMIQKFFEKNFFGSNDSKWSNSKSYHSKSEIWRPLENIPFSSSLARHLEIFRKIFEKKNFVSKVCKWFNSISYHSKSEIWRLSKNFFLQAVILARNLEKFWDLKIFWKVFKFFLSDVFQLVNLNNNIWLFYQVEEFEVYISLKLSQVEDVTVEVIIYPRGSKEVHLLIFDY